jgi:putative sigma-54 modulation protein
MEKSISGKHFEVTDELREQADKAADRLQEDYRNQKISSIRFLFSEERNWQIVHIHLNAKQLTLQANCKSNDMKASLAGAVDKMDKQLRRYLEKVQMNSIKAEPAMKEKIWTSAELVEAPAEDDWENEEF